MMKKVLIPGAIVVATLVVVTVGVLGFIRQTGTPSGSALTDEDKVKIMNGTHMLQEVDGELKLVEVYGTEKEQIPMWMTRTIEDFFYAQGYTEVALEDGFRFNVMTRYAEDISVEKEEWPIDGVDLVATCYRVLCDGVESGRFLRYPADYRPAFESQYGPVQETLFFDESYAVTVMDVEPSAEEEHASMQSNICWCLYMTLRK